MANFFMDQKGRLLSTVFPTYRGDGSIGGPEVLEVTVDLSQIGANNVFSSLGVQSGLPNGGLGLAAGDTVDVAVLPSHSAIRNVEFLLDTTQASPDVIAAPAQAGPLTVATINVGDQAVLLSDYQTAATPAGYTASATRVAGAQTILTANNSLLPVVAALYPRVFVTAVAADYRFVLRVAIATVTGAANVKAGRFRMRINIDAFGSA